MTPTEKAVIKAAKAWERLDWGANEIAKCPRCDKLIRAVRDLRAREARGIGK